MEAKVRWKDRRSHLGTRRGDRRVEFCQPPVSGELVVLGRLQVLNARHPSVWQTISMNSLDLLEIGCGSYVYYVRDPAMGAFEPYEGSISI